MPSSTLLFEDEVPAHQDLRVTIDTPGINLSVRPGPARHVGIRVEVETPLGETDVERLQERLNIALTEEENALRITSTSPFQSHIGEWRAFEGPVQVTVYLPSDLDVEACCDGGEMEVVGLKGDFSLETNGGSMRVEDVDGNVSLRSRASDVQMRYCSGEAFSFDATGGTLECTALTAERIDMKLRSCEARLERLAGTLSLEASRSKLHAALSDGTVELHASRTPVTLVLEKALPTVVYAAAADVRLNLPRSEGATLQLAGTSTALAEAFAFSGEVDAQLIEGRLGDGGPLIYVEASTGSVFCDVSD